MKKNIFIIVSIIVCAAGTLSSCNKDSDPTLPETNSEQTIPITVEGLVGFWQQYSTSYAGQTQLVPKEAMVPIFDFRKEGTLINYDYNGEYRGVNAWNVSEGNIVISRYANPPQGYGQRDIDPQTWYVVSLTANEFTRTASEYGEQGKDYTLTYRRVTDLPTLFGVPDELK